MPHPRRVRVLRALLAGLLATAAAAPVAAAPAADNPPDDGPTPTPLTVSAMLIASDANLVVESFGATVAADRITYDYRLKNKGTTPLSLAANVALPDLELSTDGNAIYTLPASSPDNPVALTVKADDKPVATAASIQALALGLDRLADLNAEHIPLVPFSADTEKALAAAPPATVAKLSALGLVSPRDPAQPALPVVADWSLRVTHGWTQPIAPGATTALSIGFAPIKASYTVDQTSLAAFDDLKDQICLTAKISAALKAALKAKDATMDIVDMTLATEKPVRWIDAPTLSVQVRKPKPTSLVAFCGADPATEGQPVVKGTAKDDGSGEALRIMMFTPSTP